MYYQLVENYLQKIKQAGEGMGVINKKSVIYSIYIFLASRASVAGIAPFGPAAFAISLMSYDMSYGLINVLLYALSCVVGALSTGVWQQTALSIVTVILFTTGYYFLKTSLQNDYPFVLKCSMTLVLSITAPMIIILAATNSTIMDIINLAIQAAVSFIMFFVYRITEAPVADYIDNNLTRYKSTQEELACFAITAIVAFLGLPALNIFGLSIRNMISIVVIMIFSLKGGIGTGAAAGVMIGIITNTKSALMICLFSFCGFLAGLLNKFKKTGIIISFVVGNIILAAMLGATKEIIHAMYETGFASIAFAILPTRFYDFIKIPVLEEAAVNKKQNNDVSVSSRYDHVGKVRNAAMKKARFFSETMTEMSEEFMDIVTSAEDKKKHDSCVMRVYDKVCSDCKMESSCWKKDYKKREKALRQCEKIIEQSGDKNKEIIEILNEFCIKPDCVTEELRIGIEIRRIEKLCNAKITECKSMVVKQFGEMGRISSQIAEEIKTATSYDTDLERRIIENLKRNEIYAFDVVAVNSDSEEQKVSLYIRNKIKKEKLKEAEKIISKETGRCMKVYSITEKSKKSGTYEIKLAVKPEMKVYESCQMLPADDNTVSGDSYSFVDTKDGNVYAILSDGMGTGKNAQSQSESVIRIMQLYIKSGVNISSAVSTINMLLSAKSTDVSTASVDICHINMYKKMAGFVKMGAMPSLIISRESVKIVEINRPPAGITVDLEELSYTMCEYDISEDIAVVMFTDGIFDAFIDGGVNKRVFYEYVANIIRKFQGKDKCEKGAAEEILKKASEISQKHDDMSVLVMYFE